MSWTEAAAKMIEGREYRYISPVFLHNAQTGEILKVKGASLVQTPALELTALASLEEGLDFKAALCTALGLAVDSPDDLVLEKACANAAPDPAKYVPIATFKEVFKERLNLQAELRQKEVGELVEKAIYGGYVTPAMREWAIAMCSSDPKGFKELLEGEPAYGYLFETKRPLTAALEDSREARLSKYDEEINQQLGLTPRKTN